MAKKGVLTDYAVSGQLLFLHPEDCQEKNFSGLQKQYLKEEWWTVCSNGKIPELFFWFCFFLPLVLYHECLCQACFLVGHWHSILDWTCLPGPVSPLCKPFDNHPALLKGLIWAKKNYHHHSRLKSRSFYADNRLRPLARRLLIIARPDFVFIRARKPWVRLRLMLLGWNVLLLIFNNLNNVSSSFLCWLYNVLAAAGTQFCLFTRWNCRSATA